MRALLVLLPLVLAASAAGQGTRGLVVPGAEVVARSPGPDTLQAVAGGTVGFGVRLDERGGVGHAIRLDMAAPAGWRPLLTQPSFHLGAGASELQIVGLRVPADARAGHYPVTVHVEGAEGWQTSLSKVVEVEAHAALTVALAGAPRFVVAGEGYAFSALVRNGGNVAAEVAVRARSSLGSSLDPAEAVVAVEANGTAEVRIAVETDGRTAAARDRIRVAAVHLSAPGVADEALATVEVVPRGSAIDRTGPAPVVGSVSAVSVGAEVAPLLGLEGALPLDREGRQRAEFRLDGVGPASGSVFARAPEAWAQYTGAGGEAFVGTGAFVLTPVTSSSTYGFGASGHAALGRADLAALVRYPWIYGGRGEGVDLGVGVGLWAGTWGRLSLNALAAGGARGGETATARLEVLGLERIEGEVEVGLASARDPRPVFGLRAAGRLGPLALVATADRRDAAQPGRLTSFSSGSLAATLKLARETSLWGSWRGSRRGDSRLQVAVEADERTGRAGLRTAVEVGGVEVRAAASGQARQVDRGGDRRGLALGEGALDVAWGGLKASVDVGAGRVRLSDGVLRPAWSARGALGLHTRALDLSASHAASVGTSLWASTPTREWSTALDGAARLGPFGLRASLTAGRFEVDLGDFGGLVQTASAMARLEASARLGLGRELVLAGYRYRSAGAPLTHLRATLRVPVPVTLPAESRRHEIHGRFVDAAGDGIAGVLVYHGEDRVVTDGRGAFAFATTEAGGYLFLDRATLGADRVPLQAFPLPAAPGEPLLVEVARRVTLRGALRRVAVYGTGATADTSDVGGVAMAVVQAVGMGQRHRALTDAEGRFAFDDLPAGTYDLGVVRAVLPERHRLEHETLTVAVEDEATVTWRVVPEQRELRMLGGAAGPNRLTLSADAPARVVRAAPPATPPAAPAAEAAPPPAGRAVLRAPVQRIASPADATAVRPAAPPVAEAPPTPVRTLAPVAPPPAETGPVRTVVEGAPEARPEDALAAPSGRVVTQAPVPEPSAREGRPTVHRAEIGEHLLAIGRRYGLSEAEVRALNPGVGDHLVVGQPVRLRGDVVRPTVHLARPGEHLLSIGRAYGLSETAVRALNPGLGDHLEVGQPVRVAGAPSRPATHRVAPGEHLLSIGRRYGLSEAEVRALNPGLGDHLEVGQTVRLRPAPSTVDRRHRPGGRW